MMNDKATIYLTSLVGFGAVVLILMLFCTALIILTLKGHFSHHIENLEKLFFVITFIVIICLFIIRFRPV